MARGAPPRGRALAAALILAALATGLAGCVGTDLAAADPARSDGAPAAAGSTLTPSQRFGANEAGADETGSEEIGSDAKSAAGRAPTRIRIPSLDLDEPLGPSLELGRGGELEAPVRPQDAGWYVDSPAPGDVGPAVIAGHLDSADGPAVFARLGELRRGDVIEVTRGDGRDARFRVVRTEQHPKSAFPTAAVYGPTPDRALRLITCGGAYERGPVGYTDNVVVYAVAA